MTGKECTGNTPCDLQRLGCSGPLLSRLAVLRDLPSRDRGGEENPGAAGLGGGGHDLPAFANLALGKPGRRVGRLSQATRTWRGAALPLQDEHYLLSRAGPTRASEVYFEGMRSVFGSPRNLACPHEGDGLEVRLARASGPTILANLALPRRPALARRWIRGPRRPRRGPHFQAGSACSGSRPRAFPRPSPT